MEKMRDRFSFEISLSVLNHLGRNLYRSFMTVIGEAISNSWDADAENVWIYLNKTENSFIIKDDGNGMTADDFQNKFLKIGYSKRKEGSISSRKGRPFIGRKGIGKLALLSYSEKISIVTKTINSSFVGGVIDNSDLDKAIINDQTPDEYRLDEIQLDIFSKYIINHKQGTIIFFENIKEGIKNSSDYLKKLIALYFRFSLIDKSFNIFVDDEKITLDNLDVLAKKTQFLWNINNIEDPFINDKLMTLENLKESKILISEIPIKGFIASVDLPRDLKITSTEEKIGVDLFVNGRLRETDILKHIPTARIVENYLYGQIHFDGLDGEIDRFTSSREGIVADDPMFKKLLESLKKILIEIIDDWDKWRIKHKKAGDSENKRISERERKSKELFNVVSEDYSLPEESDQKVKVISWVDALGEEAQFNFSSYAECFISENLIRKLIEDKNIQLSPQAEQQAKDWREKVARHKLKGNLSIDLRQKDDDLAYLSMDDLAYLIDNKKSTAEPCLARDADEYRPIRDALMHTALLTAAAKIKLTAVYENIKGRLKTLLSTP